MLSTLPQVSKEHHARLVLQIDHMPVVADLIGAVPPNELRPHVTEVCRFLTQLLIPHMEATEKALYPELERMLQNRHSMTSMKREHADIRRRVAELESFEIDLGGGRFTTGQAVELRRAFFHLYALLKVHLAEEELYLAIVEHGISGESADALAAAMEHTGIGEF